MEWITSITGLISMFTSSHSAVSGLLGNGGDTAQILICYAIFKQLSLNKRLISSVESMSKRVDKIENKVDLIKMSH